MAAGPAETPLLPETVAPLVEAFADRLGAAFGPRLRAVVAYGSVLLPGWNARRSDVNLLVVLDEVRTADLCVVAGAAEHRRARLNPVVLAATDLPRLPLTAPLVLADLLHRCRPVWGDSPLAGLAVEPASQAAALRAELHDKLFRLRAAYPGAATRPEQLRELLTSAFASVMHLLRHALRLAGRPADLDPVAAIGELARHLKLDLATLQRFYGLCYAGEPLRRLEGPALYDALLALLEQAVAQLDPKPAPKPKAKKPPKRPAQSAAEPAPTEEVATTEESRPAAQAAPTDEPAPTEATAPSDEAAAQPQPDEAAAAAATDPADTSPEEAT